MRRTFLIAASVIVSALFLWLAVRDVDLEQVLDSIRQADVGWLALSLLTTASGLLTRAIRWRGLLGNRVPLIHAFHIVNITNLMNQLPLRAGEVARSLLSVREGVPIVTAATSIIVERLLDTLLVVVLLAAALSQLPNAPELATRSAALFGAASVMGFVMLVVLARYPGFAVNLLRAFEKRIPLLGKLPLRQLLAHMIEGLEPLTHWRSAAQAIGWTVISWAFSYTTFYALHRALSADPSSILLSTALALTLASFSIAIPVSVAAVGPFEAAVRVAGEAVNMPAILATSLGFLIHGMNLLSYAVWGTLGMLAMGVSLADVARAAQQDTLPGKTT